MANKIIIIGVNIYSEYLFQTIKKEGVHEVIGFALRKEFRNQNEFCGLKVYVLENLKSEIRDIDFAVLPAIGYSKMNKYREEHYNLCKSLGYNVFTYISTRAICDSDEVGEGSIIMPASYVPPCVNIGKCNVINVGSYISHSGSMGDFNWISGNVTFGGNVHIGNKCFIGMGTVIRNDLTVESEVFIGAQSYLQNNAFKGLAYMGQPAVNTKNLKSKTVCDFI